MEKYFPRARRLRLAGAACAGLAALLLAAAIILFEGAVSFEGRYIGDVPTYPAGASLILLLIAAGLGFRAAADPGSRGVAASSVSAILAACVAVVAAFFMVLEAIQSDVVICVDGSSAWLAAYTGASPNPCGGYIIPKSEQHLFTEPANIALAGGVLGVVAMVLFFFGRKRWKLSATPPAQQPPQP